jgi:mannose-6-phosphate isomerase class I
VKPAYNPESWRKTTQDLAPARHTPTPTGQYDIYPGFPIGSGKIEIGYEALAARLLALTRTAAVKQITIDGYGGVLWANFRDQLDSALRKVGITASWHDVASAMRTEAEIDALIVPFLGGDDPIFGTRFGGELRDFFDANKLSEQNPLPGAELSILYGSGAALAEWAGLLVYLDVPKNEIQFRSRAGSFTNLGAAQPDDPKRMYKRMYFVDWVVLNQHKAALLPRIDVMIDEQRPDEPILIGGSDLRAALSTISRNYFRVRPWFEPGPWGGQWIKQHMPQLPQDAPNYAWSFELIVPENGLALESDGLLLEISFDCLMYHDHRAVLGECADRFGYEFPVRFDFLDTFEGGNLSVQCHPRPEYIRRHFGETFTQDETYYILDCTVDARVYLGFCEDIDPAAFRAALERSFADSTAVDVERFVNTEAVKRHDLFLIPNGTIHCSGVGTLVLEISATPYIFTFKMYDWLRMGMDGKPRPMNIQRAFDNLYFERKGERAKQELISHPYVLREGEGWRWMHLPTHPDHFYDVHRLEFERQVDVETEDSVQIMSLVEGSTITLETADGLRQRFSYAETFVVPAAAGRFSLYNEGETPAKVIKCFMKRGAANG